MVKEKQLRSYLVILISRSIQTLFNLVLYSDSRKCMGVELWVGGIVIIILIFITFGGAV